MTTKPNHWTLVRVRSRAVHSEYHGDARMAVLKEAALIQAKQVSNPLFTQQFQLFAEGWMFEVEDIDFSGPPYILPPGTFRDPECQRPSNSIPTESALALLAAYMNSDRAGDVPEEVKNGLADMAADYERHKRDAALRELAEASIDPETLRHIIENPVMSVPTKDPSAMEHVVCPKCLRVRLCHPAKFKILRVKISYFYRCGECFQPYVALDQFLTMT